MMNDTNPNTTGTETETGQQSKPEDNFATDKQGNEGFVGTSDDTSGDYLTEEGKQDFAPEGQGATDTNAGTADIESGQPTSSDATLDDGASTAE